MLVKVLTIISISISICSGNIFPHAVKQHSQNQATSSVMFQSQDAPLGYKYNSYHPPPTIYQNNDKKPTGYQPIRTPSPVNLPTIQYAPLLKPGELYLQNTKFNKVHFYNQQRLLDSPSKINTKHLEPRLEGELSVPSAPSADSGAASAHDYQSHPLSHLDYIPGHNIQVLRSVNRSPGHNAVYRSYTDRPQSDKQNEINHLNQYIIHPNQRHYEYSTKFWINAETPSISSISTNPSTVTTPTTTTTKSTTMTTTTIKPMQRTYLLPYKETKQHYIPKHMAYKADKPLTLEKPPYTKMHSLLLNVARSYNLAMAPHRALHAGANPTLLGKLHHNLPTQTLMKVPGSTDLHAPLTDLKTILYPVQKNLHFTIHSKS